MTRSSAIGYLADLRRRVVHIERAQLGVRQLVRRRPAVHDVTIPAAPTTVTANYRDAGAAPQPERAAGRRGRLQLLRITRRNGGARLVLAAPSRGRLAAIAKTRRRRPVAAGLAKARRAGRVRLQLGPLRRARRLLAQPGPLPARVLVRFRPATGSVRPSRCGSR